MDTRPLPFRSTLTAYEQQAADLLEGHRTADPAAIDLFHGNHPRFLDEQIRWRRKPITASEIHATALTLDDARLALARYYDFLDWSALGAYVSGVSHDGPVYEYEAAVEAVVHDDLAALEVALNRNPSLVHARSGRMCNFEPPIHRATRLHYAAANGVEHYRQKTPANIVEVAHLLLKTGTEPDALADMYGAKCTTMSMLVSSEHPAKAGQQVALVELLLDFGAAIEGRGTQKWGWAALHCVGFWHARCCGRAHSPWRASASQRQPVLTASMTLSACSLPRNQGTRHRAFAVAAQHGNAEIVRLLLDEGEDPNRFNPEGTHGHSTPLHEAAFAGHDTVVRLLVERGARLDIRDAVWRGTPLGWAQHGTQTHVVRYLRSMGALE